MSAIELRSDTVTRPSPGMRRAIADAEVGDDVLDGDPTVRRLEQRVAELLGMEDALFFPSGTQANQTGVALCAERGTELVLEANAHLVHYELAGVALIAGVQIRPVTTPGGVLTAALAREAGLRLHLDGARLWNAAAAFATLPATLTRGATTVMVSLSKGLGCPVGSCLAFARELRPRAWEMRKRLGGGMRQSGMLAAAGLYALEHNLQRIGDDHANAKRFAELLSCCPAVRPSAPETNIVMLDLVRDDDTADRVIPRLAERGVLVVPFAAKRLRAVTHLDVSRADVERAAGVIAEVLQ